ncbi:glycosyltransferase family 2 protein [Arenimonas sp. MALMAid1274]|uniref:glycosyltransferase family 2 protein n=1 Tax=Arenimonas sp. MALMAid1274 TaxID=3411630 RepID=UPI003BA03FE9
MATSEILEVSDPSRLPAAPVVSVLMVAYNHEAWIGAAIEGIVGQEYADGFELVIGEDCSSDRTREIALDFQRRFPNLVRVITSAHNVGPAANHARVIAAARGSLLAFCEGDDYWCHPGKLAAQARLLQENPQAAMVHADWVRSRRDATGAWQHRPEHSEHARLPLRHLQGDLFHAFYFGRILRTCTLMVRRSALEAYKAAAISRPAYRFEDTVINAYLTSRWSVAYWPEVAAVYRESPGSLLRSGVASKISFLRSSLQFDSDARRFFADRADYPQAYRWELAVGMALWALKGRDLAAFREAVSDLWRHFGILGGLRAGWETLALRLPRARRRREGQR